MNTLPFAPLTLHELNARTEKYRALGEGRASAVVRQEGSIALLNDLDIAYIDTNLKAADAWHAAAMARVNGERVAR